jgi:ribosomal protein L33
LRRRILLLKQSNWKSWGGRTILQFAVKLNPEKCAFLRYISKKGIKTDPDKIEKLKNFFCPKNLTQLWGFLGLASYYSTHAEFPDLTFYAHDSRQLWSNEDLWVIQITDVSFKINKDNLLIYLAILPLAAYS